MTFISRPTIVDGLDADHIHIAGFRVGVDAHDVRHYRAVGAELIRTQALISSVRVAWIAGGD